MIIGPGVNFCAHLFCSLVSVYFMLFWPKWPNILVTSESEGPVGCFCWGFGGLQNL